MRYAIMTASSLLVAASLMIAPALADNDFLGQAQRFLNNRGSDRDAYERGREDEIRRHQAERDQYQYHRDYYQDRHRDDRYRQDM
jgi:hypothetical protein